ncbi:hypothetical protein HNR09_002449 [Nesterenkonia xinjiangensis]|uniref:Uncharacterized protein n=1 Tax=Nesterenkonia xinjiangensis TaxID=225327 RepID=A0A7Z0KAM5_9MICC|nr:hypothetical protein [Nesterenkonia xinjiangensis]
MESHAPVQAGARCAVVRAVEFTGQRADRLSGDDDVAHLQIALHRLEGAHQSVPMVEGDHRSVHHHADEAHLCCRGCEHIGALLGRQIHAPMAGRPRCRRRGEGPQHLRHCGHWRLPVRGGAGGPCRGGRCGRQSPDSGCRVRDRRPADAEHHDQQQAHHHRAWLRGSGQRRDELDDMVDVGLRTSGPGIRRSSAQVHGAMLERRPRPRHSPSRPCGELGVSPRPVPILWRIGSGREITIL